MPDSRSVPARRVDEQHRQRIPGVVGKRPSTGSRRIGSIDGLYLGRRSGLVSIRFFPFPEATVIVTALIRRRTSASGYAFVTNASFRLLRSGTPCYSATAIHDARLEPYAVRGMNSFPYPTPSPGGSSRTSPSCLHDRRPRVRCLLDAH